MSIREVLIKDKIYTVLIKPRTRDELKVLIETNTLPDFVEDSNGVLRYYEAEQDWINLCGLVEL